MSFGSTLKAGINAVGNIANMLTDASVKNFYSLRDFYNFIRKDQNCPMSHKSFFTVVPEFNTPGLWKGTVLDSLKSAGKSLVSQVTGSNDNNPTDFKFDQYNLGRFALAIQTVGLPASFESGEVENIETPYGKKTYLKNNSSYLGKTSGNTFTMTFLQMAQPIIETFIIPWQIAIQKNTDNSHSDLRLNIIIKFYRADEIAGMDFMMNPTFIYRITGIFPKTSTLIGPAHGPQSSLSSRQVTFAFNNIMVFSTADYEKFITGGTKQYFAYDNLSPIQILNKLNTQATNIATAYNQVKNIF